MVEGEARRVTDRETLEGLAAAWRTGWEPAASSCVIEVHDEVAGLLGQPGAGRMGGDAEDVDLAGGVFDDEERVEPGEGESVKVEQVAGQDPVSLSPEKFRPGRSGPSWRGVDHGSVEDLPHGGGADLVAQACEFAVYPSVSPGRVLGGQAHRQYAKFGRDGWPAGSTAAGGAAAGNESRMPAQDRGWRDEQPGPTVHGQQADKRSVQCPVGPEHPWSRTAAVQDGELVAQHEDLDVLVRR